MTYWALAYNCSVVDILREPTPVILVVVVNRITNLLISSIVERSADLSLRTLRILVIWLYSRRRRHQAWVMMMSYAILLLGEVTDLGRSEGRVGRDAVHG